MDLMGEKTLVGIAKFHTLEDRNASRAKPVPGSQQTDGLLASPLSISISQANQNLVKDHDSIPYSPDRQESQFERSRSVAVVAWPR